jgi:hypothetical protein
VEAIKQIRNAENLIIIRDPVLAAQYRAAKNCPFAGRCFTYRSAQTVSSLFSNLSCATGAEEMEAGQGASDKRR